MLKKRVIFTLLYDAGQFVLSRNFRLQRVGDINWLKKNYNFSHIAFFIDELIVLDVTRGEKNIYKFCEALESIADKCFVPISAGGGIVDSNIASQLFRSGADKIVVNTAIFENIDLVESLGLKYGIQSIVGSLDLRKNSAGTYTLLTHSGGKVISDNAFLYLNTLNNYLFGEFYLNSIDRDGTGNGYDLDVLDAIPRSWRQPLIVAGGVGNVDHFKVGLKEPRVSAVATAHLFNFVGDGLEKARKELLESDFQLARWPDISFLNED
jgi:cyclase